MSPPWEVIDAEDSSGCPPGEDTGGRSPAPGELERIFGQCVHLHDHHFAVLEHERLIGERNDGSEQRQWWLMHELRICRIP